MAGGPAFDPAEAAKSLQSFAMSFRTESETRWGTCCLPVLGETAGSSPGLWPDSGRHPRPREI